MKAYDFTVTLRDVTELDEELADRLFAAGCDDGTPGSCDGVVSIDFSRESTDLESAIRSAIANVLAAGFVVDRVELDAEAMSTN